MKITFAVLSLALAAALGSQGATNLVTNGGFETGDFTGWTVSGPITTNSNPSLFYGVDAADAASGSYGAYLSTLPGQAALVLSQTLTLTPGTSYLFSFNLQDDAGALPGFGNSFVVTLNGTTLYSVTNAGATPYQQFTVLYNTSSSAPASEVLSISSTNTASFWSLDNVSLTASTSPEPASFLLAVPAALGMLWLRRRSKAN